MSAYDHLVVVDETTRALMIYRVDPSGRRVLFTSTALPETAGWCDDVQAFAALLGENILIDSPAARRALDL